MYKFLLLLFFIFVLPLDLLASKIDYYHGQINFGNKNGYFNGVTFKDNSEDDTIYYKIGFRRALLEDFKQNETFFKVKKETDLAKHVEFGIHQITNKLDRGNLYMIGYSVDNRISYHYLATYSEFVTTDVYQLNAGMNSFLGDSSFYIAPKLYLIRIQNDRNYVSLDFKLGYMRGKNEFSLSNMIGKNRYLFQENEYFSCNLGYTTRYLLGADYIRQLNLNYMLDFSLRKYYLENTSNLSIYSLTISYKY